MDCGSARRVLRESEPVAIVSPELAGARAHEHRCPHCQKWRRGETEWRAALREKLLLPSTPAELKERIFDGVARARVGEESRRRRLFRTSAIAALILIGLSLAGAWWWRDTRRDGLLLAALTEDHLLYATHPSPVEFLSADPAAVGDWFASRLQFAVHVPAFRGSALLGGRLCTLADRRVALCLYDVSGRRMSLFQMPAEGLPLGSLRTMSVAGRQFQCGDRKGVSVLVWKDREILFALVSSLTQEEMLRLASL